MKLAASLIFAAISLLGSPPAWIGHTLKAPFSQPAGPSQPSLPHQATWQPVQTGQMEFTPRAHSLLAIDLASGRRLVAHQADARLPIASLTKLMTALVILEHHQPSQTVTIPTLPPLGAAEAKIGLVAGQQMTIGDLVQALLIPSANDAAIALAIVDAGSEAAFSAKMNNLAKDWGLADTNFSTPSGLQEDNNYATATSLAKLGSLAWRHPFIRQAAGKSTERITAASGEVFQLTSTNQLLSDQRVRGLKTGYTIAAGQSLMVLANIQGHEVLSVVLNSPDRFGETSALLNWIEQNYHWY